MKELNFSTGVKTYTVNGKGEISFNPTDSNFVKRLYEGFESLDAKQEGYKSEIQNLTDKKEIFEFANARDKEMRDLIDTIFQQPVSEVVFEGLNVYALADGLPLWANFILSIFDEIDGSVAKEQKATNPRIAKYTAKYKKYTN